MTPEEQLTRYWPKGRICRWTHDDRYPKQSRDFAVQGHPDVVKVGATVTVRSERGRKSRITILSLGALNAFGQIGYHMPGPQRQPRRP